jgi:uncharacterized glyoxalase superfamily protein PhnB
MTKEKLELFLEKFIDYHNDNVMHAELDPDDNLIIFASPYRDFDETTFELCDRLLDTVDFREQLKVKLYHFGSNEFVEIWIN